MINCPFSTPTSGRYLIAMALAGVNANPADCAEAKTYTKPAVTAFSSQMDDALLGGGKFEKPVWNLHDALQLPKWLDISIEQRTRYESLDGRFTANAKGGDQQIPLQTDLWLQAHLGQFRFATEFVDSRALGADSGSGVNNTHADTADFLQGYIAWADQNVFYSGLGTEVVAGRQTLNLGSRRLVARNAMRNTMNTFTGVKLRVLDYDKWQFTSFVTMPVLRYPNTAVDILDETHEFDEEDTHTWFSGGFLEVFDIGWGVNSEVYLYNLDEGDSIRNQTRNRRYFTPGMRFYRKPGKDKFDFQTETIGQFGTVRASTAASASLDQEHSAWFQHLDVGYTLGIPWSPRLGLEYDYASGDHDPNDNKDQRFDTLYGVRRGDFGATGIYGAFARSNINSPGYRINLAPTSAVQLGLSHRFFWLAEDKDGWTTSGTATTMLRDRTGKTKNFIGQQLELTARWDFNSSLNFETGWTHLFKGTFAKTATNAPAPQDIDYFYVQSLFRF
ncbi:alginate export family protein [Methylomonas sp. MED-D]|uniref:alginate export family protein n=2 Tax=unclassified Methylomonas TaxID=2608980 RepID=UPI0008D92AAF|nr:alginate export family protein [Methylococcaceae bacterium WWC4]OHX35327.1 hypothetical protein BJL95_00605 [Methylomonas sp. LWB]